MNGGAVDEGQCNGSCTHVIVNEISYVSFQFSLFSPLLFGLKLKDEFFFFLCVQDDPVCVAARNDGKTVVTALWVDHSADIGMPLDAASVSFPGVSFKFFFFFFKFFQKIKVGTPSYSFYMSLIGVKDFGV